MKPDCARCRISMAFCAFAVEPASASRTHSRRVLEGFVRMAAALPGRASSLSLAFARRLFIRSL